MNVVMTLFYFTLALLLLVIVHEFGHFIVARLCGVKVLRFSFGFGKVLASFHDKRGTEYAWSLFPFGGYVKMLDEEEGPVTAAERHLAFNQQSVWAKIAIALAGPLFNFIFAFAALWLVLVVGILSLAPMISSVTPASIAAKSGLTAQEEIIALNHQPIGSWRDFQYALIPLMGTHDPVSLTVKSMVNGQLSTHHLALADWQLDGQHPDLLATLGIHPFVPSLPPIVGEVLPHSPADTAGFRVLDVVASVDGVVMTDWLELLDVVKKNPGKRMFIEVKRQGKLERLPVEIGVSRRDGHAIGLLGVRSKQVNWPVGWLRVQREGPVVAIGHAFKQTVSLTKTTFVLMGRLVTGKVSLRGISGPVGIAEGAGESARGGFSYYVFFLALMSISLGALNLLPIPLLDGGHLLYYCLELIRRRPLSAELRWVGMVIGFTFLMALMVVALTNDLGRLASQF